MLAQWHGPDVPAFAAVTAGTTAGANHTETELVWLAREIVSDIAEIVHYAKTGSLLQPERLTVTAASGPADGGPRFDIALAAEPGGRPLGLTISIDDHFWSPASYEPLARALLDLYELKAGSGTLAGPALLPRLADIRASTLVVEDRAISRQLAAAPLDAPAHERAALLIGVFALRESAGRFSDTRPALCRISAHLSLARALRAGAERSLDAEYADILLVTLSGRQRDALDRLEARKPNAVAAEAPWIRALTMRNTHDYRLLPAAGRASLLERLEQFRARSRSLAGARALEAMERTQPERVPDWARIAFASAPSVETGNVLSGTAVAMELEELQATWRAVEGKALRPGEWMNALDGRPARCITRRGERAVPGVIHWGTWAAYFQRHLAHVLTEVEAFYGYMLGDREGAKAFREHAGRTFGAFDLYPFVVHHWEARLSTQQSKGGTVAVPGSVEADKACANVLALFKQRPGIVTARNWDSVTRGCGRERDSRALPEYSRWFSTRLPWGTGFDAENRTGAVPTWCSYTPARLEEILRICPNERAVITRWLSDRQKRGLTLTRQELEARAGALPEYDWVLGAWRLSVLHDSPVEQRRLLERRCAENADECLLLAEHLVGVDESAAVRAYERAVKDARDRVGVASRCGWLADYYFDHGQERKAEALATMAADVFSGNGLFLRGRLFERTGQYEGAEALYETIAKRYNEESALLQFHLRREMRDPSSGYRKQAGVAMNKLFPRGLRPVVAGDLTVTTRSTDGSAPAPDGVVLDGRHYTEPLAKLGAKLHDRILGVDGYRIDSWEQVVAIESFTDEQRLSLVVQRGSRFLELTGPYPRSRFGPLR
jgi:hypothetical protein